jgi:hypothetical protein
MVNNEELIGTTEYLTLWTRCRINQCRYNRVRLYFVIRQQCKRNPLLHSHVNTEHLYLLTATFTPTTIKGESVFP